MRSIRRSLAFSFSDRYLVYLIGLAGTVVLSRLLTPAEFGVFAVAAGIVTVVDTLRDFGIATYIVQERALSQSAIRTAFTVNLLASALGAAVLLAASRPFAAFYGESGLTQIIPFFAASFLLMAFSTTSSTLMRRDLRFDSLALINVAAAFANIVVVVTLACFGFGYMSFAWATVASAATRTVLALGMKPVFWAFRPCLAEWPKVVGFGGYSTATAFINVFHDSLPNLIVGRVLGFEAVGLLSRTASLCQIPDRLFMNAVHPVVLPALAERARQDGDLKEPYLRSITYITALQWPVLLSLALMADPVVRLLLGEQWSAVAPLLRISALASMSMFPAFLTFPVLVAVGRVREALISSLISLPPSILVIFGASFIGLEAVAASQFLTMPFQVYVALRYVRRHVDFSWSELLSATVRSAVVALATAAPILVVVALNGFSFAISVPMMFGLGAAGLVCWLAGLRLSRHPFLQEVSFALTTLRSGHLGRERLFRGLLARAR